ncbi:hypothetical protein Y032_0363g3542 [Ancylostoma ceylanicum]|uniref:Uncharacterized protein n=1 Tax=Ancylostoma ceylanicum TaxID=53326 RepID=A0A016RVD0_9BILA|nr:hypothetical protein Y032_0363g3542 [Ancylostoma ceylanicum]
MNIVYVRFPWRHIVEVGQYTFRLTSAWCYKDDGGRSEDDADSATITPSYLNSFNSDPQHIVQLCVAPCQFKQSPQHHGVQRSDDKLEEKKEDRKRERQEEEYIQFIMVQAFPDFKLFT